MAIVGEEIEKYVKDQIIARQKLHGSGTSTNRTNEQITLLNSQNAWVKLASGVSVTEEKCNELGVDPGDNKEIGLAKNNVLFGGLSKLTGTTLQQKSNFLPGTYSNSSDGFGIVPMPGIESVNIKTLTRGSVKSATIKMKAYSRDQYYILDTLYLRLGYIVLLEWGNNIYTTDGTDKNNLDYTVIEDKDGFFNTSSDNKGRHTSKIVGKIGSLRRKYQGNYDGMLGQITNFNWTFKDDGSYDISVEIHSLGSVIESLKLNQVVDSSLKKFAKDTDGVNVSDATEDQKGREKSYIHYVLWLLKYINEGNLDSNYVTMIDDNGNPQNLGQFLSTTKSPISTKTYKLVVNHLRYTDGGETYTITTRTISEREKDDMWGTIYDIFNTEGHYYGSDKADEYTRAWYTATSGAFKPGGFIKAFSCVESGETTITNPFTGFKETDTFRLHCDPEYEYFIRFGALLKFIEDKIIPTIDKKDGDKIVKLSYTLSRMYFLPNQLSLDPRVCFLRNQVRVLKDDGSKFEIEIGKELERVLLPAPFIRKKEERNVGNAMNIYLNLNFVYESIDSNTDEKGNLSIFSFLSAICTRLNQVLGGINNLEPVIDEITNVCSIIDTTPIPGAVKDTGDYILDLYGYAGKNKDESNFIRKLDIKTAITPEYATMVTVGATAGGYTKGIEATAFNKWNKGIKDRFKERIVPSDNTKSDGTPKPTPAEEYYENYLKKKSQILGYDDSSRFPVSGQGDTISPDVIDRNLSIVPEFYKFALAEKTRSTKGDGVTGGTIGFIPFKLQFTMDGLAGIKIYNVLHIDTSFLPKVYGKSLNFIVTGYEHRLTKDDWETIITVNVMPKSTSSEDGTANNIINYDFLETLYLDDLIKVGKGLVNGLVNAFKNILNGDSAPNSGQEGTQTDNTKPVKTSFDAASTNTPLLKKAVYDQSRYWYNIPTSLLPGSPNSDNTNIKSYPYPSGKVNPTTGRKSGEISGLCAGWSYRIAYKLKEHIDKKSTGPIRHDGVGGGHAYQKAHINNIHKLGGSVGAFYEMSYAGRLNKDQIVKMISSNSWNYGDMINYHRFTNQDTLGYHTQIYTGDIYKKWNGKYWDRNKKKFRDNKGSVGWSTSNASNYGASFVYNSPGPYEVYVFKVKKEYLI